MSVDRPGLIDSMISDVNASGYLPPVPLRNNDTLKPDKSINHEAKKMLRKLKNEALANKKKLQWMKMQLLLTNQLMELEELEGALEQPDDIAR